MPRGSMYMYAIVVVYTCVHVLGSLYTTYEFVFQCEICQHIMGNVWSLKDTSHLRL